MDEHNVCKCPHHMVKPWAVILIGLTLTLSYFNILTSYTMLIVGVLIMVAGFMKLKGRSCKCC